GFGGIGTALQKRHANSIAASAPAPASDPYWNARSSVDAVATGRLGFASAVAQDRRAVVMDEQPQPAVVALEHVRRDHVRLERAAREALDARDPRDLLARAHLHLVDRDVEVTVGPGEDPRP